MNAPHKKTQQIIAKCSPSLQALSVRLLSCTPVQNTTQVIGVTAQYSGEGVSSVVLGLGQALGKQQKGRVLIIDAVPGPQDLTQLLNATRRHLVMKAEFDWSPLLQSSSLYGVDLLSLTVQGLEWLATDPEAAAVWQLLLADYRWVIVDVGAWSTATPHLWAPRLDQVLLVVDVNSTTADKLTRFRAEMDHSQLRMLGFVMNKRTYPIPEKLYRLAS